MTRTAAALASVLALAACGRLETPDLSAGTLSGRLVGASANAYVYPLGRPDLMVHPAADGSWVLERLPAGPVELVLVDGAPGAWLAERLALTVPGGDLLELPAQDAASLAPAGRVAAVARFGGACESTALGFTVIGTDQQEVAPASAGSAVLLERLPAGTFQLAGRSGGFVDATVAIEVHAGETLAYEVALGVSYDLAAPGCTAASAGCRPGLVCDPADGACYECVADSNCVAPKTSCTNHVCHDPALAGETCDPCSADSDCEPVTSGPPSACASAGFCTHTCASDAECPAGFACLDDGARKVCRAPRGCAEARDEFGGECFFDTSCNDDLFHGVCLGSDPAAKDPVPGYCTGHCSQADDCDLVPGFVCNPTSNLCERG